MNTDELELNPGSLGSPNIRGEQLVLNCPECGCAQSEWKEIEPAVNCCLFCGCKYLSQVVIITKHGSVWRKQKHADAKRRRKKEKVDGA